MGYDKQVTIPVQGSVHETSSKKSFSKVYYIAQPVLK